MTDLLLSHWRLFRLTLDQVGPFQDSIQTFDFKGIASDEQPHPDPANLFMLLAQNGYGKTTVLESIYGLFGLLNATPTGRFAAANLKGRAQLDIQASWTIDGQRRDVVLSIWTGCPDPLVTWTSQMLQADARASDWATLGLKYADGTVSLLNSSDELGRIFFSSVQSQYGVQPETLFGETQVMPTVLFFPADRLLVSPPDTRAVVMPENWTYQPAQCFGTDGKTWSDSIDNLLVWLEWLDDGRLESLVEFVNTQGFQWSQKQLRPPRRAELLTYVRTSSGEEHPLIGLSHGERAMLQLFVRVAAHMTMNTIVLIDEVEMHLHTRWMNIVFQVLKRLVKNDQRLSIIFTTHNRELMRVFDHKKVEDGIIRGGNLIEEGIH